MNILDPNRAAIIPISYLQKSLSKYERKAQAAPKNSKRI
jgi:hypothetical protein